MADPDEPPRVVRATREIDEPAAAIFELIADPFLQPSWDGNDNLAHAEPGQRVHAVGAVFVMRNRSGNTRENHVVEFEEGHRIAWRPAEPGQPPAGHLWRWELEPLGPSRTRVTHTYDWNDLPAGDRREARALATTADRLQASLDRLAKTVKQRPAGTGADSPTTRFRAARDYLLAHREDYATAYRDFRWPELDQFNWATDWFDVLATENGATTALWVVEEDGSDTKMSFAELRDLSQRLAGYLSAHGVGRGDRVLLLLGNCAPLWVAMLACVRMGAVMIPAATLLSPADLADRIDRGHVRAVVAAAADTGKFGADTASLVRLSVGAADGWLSYDDGVADGVEPLVGGGTAADETLLLYFTSGTTAQPKLVEHTHASYPVGHLSTMYWIGVQPGDRHLNISSPGWAKHAWSCLFAPWNAGATIVVYNYARFDPAGLLEVLERVGVTTFCAPPTVWRMVAQAKLGGHRLALRECVGAGEPLNPEVIEVIERAWGITIRDGYGQTETTAQVGNPPGALVKLGSMGRPLPGYVVALVDPVSDEVGRDGEICLQLQPRPVGLMAGYRDDATREATAMRGGFYHTGDVASMDDDGYVTYVGRADDVFKASDYRISPFELESVLIEHPAVAEAAVVPSPDPVRTSVPKAYVVLAAGHEPSKDTAFAIMRYAREHLAPYKRIRRLEFAELPKTISGKIRRVELRADEAAQVASGTRPENAYTEDDFPDLKT